MELAGKVALVTGGSGTLGGLICRELCNAGVHVAVGYASGKEKSTVLAQELTSSGPRAISVACDVTDDSQVAAAVSSTESELGRLDILVNDGAYNKSIPFEDLDAMFEEWQQIMDINLTGPMRMAKTASKVMRLSSEGGRIVNISSVAGLTAGGSSVAYAVSKAGLNHLTRCLAKALAPNILVNCIAPGYLEGTLMSERLTEQHRQRSINESLLQRAASKEDIARQTVEFCRTDTVTGQTLVIDSGRVLH